MKENIKDGKNIELDDITVINESYQDLGKEPEEEVKAEEEAKEEKKEEPADEAEAPEEEKEEVSETKEDKESVEEPKIEAPVIPMPSIEAKEEPASIGGFEIPVAPVEPVIPAAPVVQEPVVQFPSTFEPMSAPINNSISFENGSTLETAPSLSFGQGLTNYPIPSAAAPTNFNSEEELNNFFDGLIDKSNKRHEEEINGIEDARVAAMGTFKEKKAIKEWRAKLMDYSAFEQPMDVPTGTYTQDEPLKKIA